MKGSTPKLALLALLTTSIFWGPAPVVVKIGLREIPPLTLGVVRFILASLIVAPYLWSKRDYFKKISLWRLFSVGVLGTGFNTLFIMIGLQWTTASTTAAIFATVPVLTAVAAFFVLKEKPVPAKIAGIMIGFLGTAVIVFAPLWQKSQAPQGQLLGNLFIFAAVCSWTSYIISSKKVLEKVPAVFLSSSSFLAGALFLLPFAVWELTHRSFSPSVVGPQGLFSIFYMTIVASLGAFFLYQWGLKHTSASTAGIVTYLNPPIATLTAFLVLGEKITFFFILGTALILFGVFMASSYEYLMGRKRKGSLKWVPPEE